MWGEGDGVVEEEGEFDDRGNGYHYDDRGGRGDLL